MRDARINTIGEGANEVLLAFIAAVGMRDVGLGLKSTLEGLMRPRSFLPTLWSFSREHMGRMIRPPAVPCPRRCCGRWPIRWLATSPGSRGRSSGS